MRRVVFWTAIAYISGIYATRLLTPATAFFAALAVLLFFAAVLLIRPRRGVWAAALLCAAFLMGFLYFSLRESAIKSEVEPFAGDESVIHAKVLEVREGENTHVLLKSVGIESGAIESKKPYKIYLTLSGGADFECGDTVKVSARLKQPKATGNIGGPDFSAYLAARGVYLTAFAQKEDIEVIERAKPFSDITTAAARARGKIVNAIQSVIPGGEGALITGVLIGEKGKMPEEVAESFRKAGLSHIIAVSGMHLGIVLAFALFFIRAAGIRRRGILSSIICLSAIWLFALISGFGMSTVRAGIMASLFILSELFGREVDGLTSLGWAMLLITLISPAAAFDLGLMLSAGATLSILIFAKPLSEKLAFLGRVSGGVSVCLSAQHGIMPVLALTFGWVPLGGILANLVVVPLVPILMVLGAAAALTAPLAGLGAALAYPAKALAGFIFFIARVASEMPLSTVVTGSPGFLELLAYAFVLIGIYHVLKSRKSAALLSFNAAAALILVITVLPFGGGVKLHFINVGQGDCALITTPEGNAVMIDAGGARNRDIGKEILEPYLKMSKIKRIDAALLTHYHYDHLGGYLHLLRGGLIKRLYIPETYGKIPLKLELEAAAAEGGAEVGYIKAGDELALRGGGVITAVAGSAGDEGNEDCLVYRFDYGESSALFTADMTGEAEERLSRLLANLSCDILKVSHHGSKTSSNELFLGYANPQYAVISVGQNYYGHPAPEVLKRLEARGIETIRTDIYGNIVFTLSKKEIKRVSVQRSGYY